MEFGLERTAHAAGRGALPGVTLAAPCARYRRRREALQPDVAAGLADLGVPGLSPREFGGWAWLLEAALVPKRSVRVAPAFRGRM